MTATYAEVDGASGTERYFRRVFELYPHVDEHEFATAYVNFVEKTGLRPSVWYAMEKFALDGVIA